MARRGHLRRTLGIPNPVQYYYLAECIATNWAKIERHVSRSTLTLTPASIAGGDGRAVPMLSFSELGQRRVRAYAPYRIVLQSDVTNFYRAIYTHSIPWALHGKAIAKANRSRTAELYGNSLDFYMRQVQDGQTMGLPVGPDTSRIISEIILSAIDAEVAGSAEWKAKAGLRYIDDYFLCFDTYQDAENALVALKEAFSGYELTLNADKTSVLNVSQFNEDTWPAKLQNIRIDGTSLRQGRDLVSFFSNVIEVARSNPHESIASYALRLTTGILIRPENWDTYAAFLLRLCRENSNILDAVAKLICTYAALGYPVPAGVATFLDGFLRETALNKQHFEVAWGLWLATSLRVPLSEACVATVEKLDNSISALMLLHMQHLGLTPRAADLSSWLPAPSERELFGRHWLLMYEGAVRGWLGVAATNVVTSNDLFQHLAQNNVHFFDVAATNRPLHLPGVEFRLAMIASEKKRRTLDGNVYVPRPKQGEAMRFAERLGGEYGNNAEPIWFNPDFDEDDEF